MHPECGQGDNPQVPGRGGPGALLGGWEPRACGSGADTMGGLAKRAIWVLSAENLIFIVFKLYR